VSESFVTRFAEQLSILLSTELSLHSLIGSTFTKPKESVEKLNSQLLDLYGDASDGDDATDGRLKTVLGHSCWDSVRQQLKNELKKAQEFEQVHNAKMDDDSSGIFFGTVGRSSNRNPFDELRMDYD
jgi:hypothetical protein